MNDEKRRGVREIFDGEEVGEVLRETFYGPKKRSKKEKPEHYEIICISLYQEDLARLDAKVKLLKGRGHRKMSRSALIRYALDSVDLDKLPRSY